MELLRHDARDDDAAASASADDAHTFLVSGVPCGAENTQTTPASDDAAHGEDALLSATASEADDDEAASFRPLPLRAPTRRKIGKSLQLVVLRKYVQCAKDIGGTPDRATTERLLDQAYDEFYFHGGDVDEQRMGYAEFTKLVRNRRGEVRRLRRSSSSGNQPSHQKKHMKEREQIRALVDDLERVRRVEHRRHTSNGQHDAQGVETSHESGNQSFSESDNKSSAARSNKKAMTTAPSPTMVDGEEHVLISKHKLSLILQSAQETLATQTKLLEQVRALERQLGDLQRLHYPLGH